MRLFNTHFLNIYVHIVRCVFREPNTLVFILVNAQRALAHTHTPGGERESVSMYVRVRFSPRPVGDVKYRVCKIKPSSHLRAPTLPGFKKSEPARIITESNRLISNRLIYIINY